MIPIEMILNVRVPGDTCAAGECNCAIEIWVRHLQAAQVPREEEDVDLWSVAPSTDRDDEVLMPQVEAVCWGASLDSAQVMLAAMMQEECPDTWREVLVHDDWTLHARHLLSDVGSL